MERGHALSVRRLRARFRSEAGFALPLALMTMLVTGSLASSAIAYSSWNYGSTKRSDADSQARALAEAGLNYAFSTLYNSGTPTMASAVPSRTITLSTGDASYYGTLTGSTWKLVGIGTVRNPTGPGSEPVVRTVSGRANLGSAHRGSANNAVWNYVYVDDPTVTTNLGNSVDVNIPLYVRGNLVLSNAAQVSGYALQVGGTLEFQNTAHVGTSDDAHPRGPCRRRLPGRLHRRVRHAVRPRPARSRDDQRRDADDLHEASGRPELVLQREAGARHPCTVGSFPGGFDNDSSPNNSRSAVNLTPSTPYDCRVFDADGNLEGQLTWVPGSPGALTMFGTIYFDGPIEFRQYNNAVYTGRATIHAAGDITSRTSRRSAGIRSATTTGIRSRTCSRSSPAGTCASVSSPTSRARSTPRSTTPSRTTRRSGARSSPGGSRSRTQQ